MDAPQRNDVKLLAAVIGGSAVVALGALSLTAVQEHAGPQPLAKSTSMTVGATSTETTPSTVEATTMAAQAIRGPAPLPAEEQGPAAT